MPESSGPRAREPSGDSRKVMGRFHCEERLGGEGPLETWRARVQGLAGFDRLFALKCLAPGAMARRPQSAENLLRAARALATLDDPRLAKVSDSGLAPGSAFVAIELVHGVTLRELREHVGGGGAGARPAGWDALVAHVGSEIAGGLAKAHAADPALVHAALAPDSVMLTPQGAVKIIDLGLRAAVHTPAEIAASATRGAYAAPELARVGAPGPAVDLYALGAMIHDLATGRARPDAAAPAVNRDDPTRGLHAELRAIVDGLMAEDPAARPGAAATESALHEARLRIRASDVRAELGALVRMVLQLRASRAVVDAAAASAPGTTGGGAIPDAPPVDAVFTEEPTAIVAVSSDGKTGQLASLLRGLRVDEPAPEPEPEPIFESTARIRVRDMVAREAARLMGSTPAMGVPLPTAAMLPSGGIAGGASTGGGAPAPAGPSAAPPGANGGETASASTTAPTTSSGNDAASDNAASTGSANGGPTAPVRAAVASPGNGASRGGHPPAAPLSTPTFAPSTPASSTPAVAPIFGSGAPLFSSRAAGLRDTGDGIFASSNGAAASAAPRPSSDSAGVATATSGAALFASLTGAPAPAPIAGPAGRPSGTPSASKAPATLPAPRPTSSSSSASLPVAVSPPKAPVPAPEMSHTAPEARPAAMFYDADVGHTAPEARPAIVLPEAQMSHTAPEARPAVMMADAEVDVGHTSPEAMPAAILPETTETEIVVSRQASSSTGVPTSELGDLTTAEISASFDAGPAAMAAAPAPSGVPEGISFAEFSIGIPMHTPSMTPPSWQPRVDTPGPSDSSMRPRSPAKKAALPVRRMPTRTLAVAVGAAGLALAIGGALLTHSGHSKPAAVPGPHVSAVGVAVPLVEPLHRAPLPAVPPAATAVAAVPASPPPAPTASAPVASGSAPAATGKPPATIEISSYPSGAAVWAGGKLRGETPIRLDVPAAAHELRLVRAGFHVRVIPLDVATPAQMETTLEPTAAPPSGDASVTIDCRTRGKLPVLVDGQEVGLLCPASRLSLPPGQHDVSVLDPANGERQTKSVTLSKGDKKLRFSL